MTPTTSGKGLLFNHKQDVYSFQCGSTNSCYWVQESYKLEIPRLFHIMLTLPSSVTKVSLTNKQGKEFGTPLTENTTTKTTTTTTTTTSTTTTTTTITTTTTFKPCKDTEWQCDSGDCIHGSDVCNYDHNCPDKSDECSDRSDCHDRKSRDC